MILRLTMLVLGASFFVGCTANHGRYALLSAEGISLQNVTADKIAGARLATGVSKCLAFLIFPVSFCSLNEAIQRAQGGGDLLTDVSVTHEQVNLFPLLLSEVWRVEGKSVRIQP
jgi:hypothetical protein